MATDMMISEETGDEVLVDRLTREHELDLAEAGLSMDRPHHWLAAVRLIDQINGLAREDDRLVLNPWIGVILLAMGRVLSPASLVPLAANVREQFLVNVEDAEAQEAAYDAALPLATQWFTICFDDVVIDGEPTVIPEPLRGKELTLRFLTEEEVNMVSFHWMATVRADGTLIGDDTEGMRQF
ncbi:MAG: hypothetical protein ACQR33_00900 [Candidatus Saccharibacteria bacterium]